MEETTIFKLVKNAKVIPPVVFAPLLAFLFLLVGEILAILINYLVIVLFSLDLGLLTEPSDLRLSLFNFAFISLIIFLWVRFVEKRSIRDLGFFRQNALKELLYGSLIGLGMYVFALFLIFISGGVTLTGFDFSWKTMMSVLMIIPFWYIQGGTEEILTRGWLFPVMTNQSNLKVGLVVSSLFFAFLHVANPGLTFLSFINLILFGIFSALLMIERRNIWVLVGEHAIWNFAQGNLFGVEVSGTKTPYSILSFATTDKPAWLTGGLFGTEGSILTSLVLLLGCFYLYRRIDLKAIELSLKEDDIETA
ncbi:CPBP family intramembrane glutamic endopeptidase [Streptococcus fryi]